MAELAVPSFESFDIRVAGLKPAEQEAAAAAAVCSRLHLALARLRLSLSLAVCTNTTNVRSGEKQSTKRERE